MIEPGCVPGSGRWGAQVSLASDISAVFPYLNAVLDDVQYDHDNKILIWGEKGQRYALRPTEIRVAKVDDLQEAQRIVAGVVERINRIWQERDNITPRYTEKKRPAVLAVFKLLPQTNCRECGYPTCMAFAAALARGTVQLKWCPPLSQPRYAEKKAKLSELFRE